MLPVDGAPLVFSTAFAHDLVLHLDGPGAGTDIPVTPDAFRGGLVLAKLPARKPLPLDADASASPATANPAEAVTTAARPATANTMTGTISGFWGFDPFKGPTLDLQDTPGKEWKLADGDVLIAGRENHLTLSSTGTACIEKISLDTATGKQVETQWKSAQGPAAVEISASLKSFDPGTFHLTIRQFGDIRPDIVTTKTYSEPATLKTLELHAGDTTADLIGTSLDEVQTAHHQ